VLWEARGQAKEASMTKILTLLAAVALTLALASDAYAQADATFGTPGDAVYCNYYGPLYCWTPNDGFSVYMTSYGRASKRYVKGNRDYVDDFAPILRFGHFWRDGRGRFRCDSRKSGLTCRNARGHGWWLGRYVGYRLF
jgi:hypothetical protein